MSAQVVVRGAGAADAAAVAAIYNHYVLHSTATFEVEEVASEAMAARIASVRAEGLPWLVAEDSALAADGAADAVVGYAYVSPLGERAAYRHSLEIAIYLRDGERGRGIGAALYAALLEAVRSLTPASSVGEASSVSEASSVGDLPSGEASVHAPVHRIYARIALPRPASVALQERFGFRQVGLLSEAGFKLGQWIDVGYWELRLDQ